MSNVEKQLQSDCDSLREIVAGLDRLERQLEDARRSIQARQRGYFTPDEDDRVRQMLLTYRNYRRALYEIIERYMAYEQLGAPAYQLRGFMVAFAAALTLYAKSLKLIQTYEHEPLVRKKLNEPDAKFELEAGFFDEVLSAYSSVRNYRLIARANRLWRSRRREIQKLQLAETPGWAWLCDLIRHQRSVMFRRFRNVFLLRLRYDWRAFWRLATEPMRHTRYNLQSLVGGAFAGLRTTTHYEPALNTEILEHLRTVLRPGDVVMVRAERKMTTAILPGFWAHSALCIGSRDDLELLGLGSHPHVQKHWDEIPADGGRYGQVLEAVSPRVRICPLEQCLHADHVAVLRPNVSGADVREAIAEAFGHVGKPYDFEFDFNVTSRIVCTELIYRSYHNRGGIQFRLVKRLGRYTLSCDDLVSLLLLPSIQENPLSPAPYRLVSLALKLADGKARLFSGPDGMDALRRIQSGWRPTTTSNLMDASPVAAYD